MNKETCGRCGASTAGHGNHTCQDITMIDINQPVKPNHDMILNYADGEQKLGSDSGFNREAGKGKLINLPPNDNPQGDVNAPDSYDNGPTGPKRDEKGHFVKS